MLLGRWYITAQTNLEPDVHSRLCLPLLQRASPHPARRDIAYVPIITITEQQSDLGHFSDS